MGTMSLLTKTPAVGVGAVLLASRSDGGGGQAKAKARFTLPTPTRQYQVGTTEIQLVDQARQDPSKPDASGNS